ncbi:MAG TPA: hypothetical protein VJA25_00540, partial [Dehalococcoidia bacterium]|nr:hypothetical protein [Dehalococcoidia bacterium]
MPSYNSALGTVKLKPDFNGDEAIWKWGRAEVTANQCLGTKAKVQEKMRKFFETLAYRTSEV